MRDLVSGRILTLAGAAAGMTAAALADSAMERRSLTVQRYTVFTEKPLGKERKLVFLSDLHDASFGEENARLFSVIRAEEPDAVLTGGDIMTVKRTADITKAARFMRKLAAEWPVYAADGNHETRLGRDRGRYGDLYDEYMEELLSAGVRVVNDCSAMLGERVRISGITLGEEWYAKFRVPEMRASFLEDRLGPARRDYFQILLIHSPMYQDAASAWGADLSLAGHFHGGTIRLPGGIGLMTPQYQFFRREVTGMHVSGGSAMIVSPGLGTHSINLRINNRPQVVVVKLAEKRQI